MNQSAKYKGLLVPFLSVLFFITVITYAFVQVNRIYEKDIEYPQQPVVETSTEEEDINPEIYTDNTTPGNSLTRIEGNHDNYNRFGCYNPTGDSSQNRNNKCYTPDVTGKNEVIQCIQDNIDPERYITCPAGITPDIAFCNRELSKDSVGKLICDGANLTTCATKGAFPKVTQQCNDGCTQISNGDDFCKPAPTSTPIGGTGGGTDTASTDSRNYTPGNSTTRLSDHEAYTRFMCYNPTGDPQMNRNNRCFPPDVTGANGVSIYCDLSAKEWGVAQCDNGGDTTFCSRALNDTANKGNIISDGANLFTCAAKGAFPKLYKTCSNGAVKDPNGDDYCYGGSGSTTTATPTNNNGTGGGTDSVCYNSGTNYSFIDFNHNNKVDIDDFGCFAKEYRTKAAQQSQRR